MSNNGFATLITDDHITVSFSDGESVTIYNTSDTEKVRYVAMLQAIADKDEDAAREIAFPADKVKKELEDMNITDKVEISNGVIMFDGTPLHNTLTTRMLSMAALGLDLTPVSRFLENLMENPSYHAVEELYQFLECSDLPITEDGHFIAYKRVGDDYMDLYTHSIDNSVGQTPTMPRNHVDDNRNNTCSNGLHFCAREYLGSYGTTKGNRTMVVKINPKDVVSIPSDYNNAKGRCCKYEVINELKHGDEAELESTVVLNSNESRALLDGEHSKKLVGAKDAVVKVNPDTNLAIQYFENAADAAASVTNMDLTASAVRRVCRGDRKTAGGYKWFWVNPSLNK